MNDEVMMIPLDQIRILNPRPRDKKKFALIVQSVQNLGLKRPIQVSIRSTEDGEEAGYDLVCGQGRIEAFAALGQTAIPAIVVKVSKEQRLLRSLVENIARRAPPTLALINEIERLKGEGYTNVEIGKKLDIADSTIGGYIALKKAGEERLLDSAIDGRVPLSVAIEIAKAETPEMQRELLKAYESKQLNFVSIRAVKRLIDLRRFVGKQRDGNRRLRNRTSAESLVNTFKRETQRQKKMTRKANYCEARLLFIVKAFNKLLADENFVTLLRAESLAQMPKYLHSKLVVERDEL